MVPVALYSKPLKLLIVWQAVARRDWLDKKGNQIGDGCTASLDTLADENPISRTMLREGIALGLRDGCIGRSGQGGGRRNTSTYHAYGRPGDRRETCRQGTGIEQQEIRKPVARGRGNLSPGNRGRQTLSDLNGSRPTGFAVVTMFSLPLSLSAGPNDEKGKGLAQRIRALERKLEHVTSEFGEGGDPELVITGANVRIVNGLGATQTTNGLGNLIVGYNERRRVDFPTVRTGSHNVVVGEAHNFFRFGGVVAGFQNEISGDFATVSGGMENTASGLGASVSGGVHSTASGEGSSVSGGAENTASGHISSISGGRINTATGIQAAVSGGVFNTARGHWASVSGGQQNTAGGERSSVTGGESNEASGVISSVSGGLNRTAAGDNDWVAGGLFQDQ